MAAPSKPAGIIMRRPSIKIAANLDEIDAKASPAGTLLALDTCWNDWVEIGWAGAWTDTPPDFGKTKLQLGHFK
jgi:hypothetical protein